MYRSHIPPQQRDDGDRPTSVTGDALEVVPAAARVPAAHPRRQRWRSPQRVQHRLELHQRVRLGIAGAGRGGKDLLFVKMSNERVFFCKCSSMHMGLLCKKFGTDWSQI
jgi:hypothetical protein